VHEQEIAMIQAALDAVGGNISEASSGGMGAGLRSSPTATIVKKQL
jgi:hypothetical protein